MTGKKAERSPSGTPAAPPGREETVRRVLARYPYASSEMRLLSDKGKKAVWSVETDEGGAILKKVPFDAPSIEFMIAAIDYMRGNGLGTPRVRRTSDGGGYVAEDGEHYVLFDAIRGRSPDYRVREELRTMLRGLAKFHVASRGFESPTGFYPSYLLSEREASMRERRKRLADLKAKVAGKPDPNAFDGLFLSQVDAMLRQCDAAMDALDRTGYREWADLTHATKTLCHQDFAAGNVSIGEDGMFYVYDMDSLTVDVPIRDLRKLLNKVMKRNLRWDLETMLTMLQAYQEGNPLTQDQYRALVAELTFPHLFYGQATKYYDGREPGWSEEKHADRLRRMIATELDKERVLAEFLGRVGEVADR
jgi:CotS family spore coat protein